MPIAIARSPRGHPTRWARNLSRAPVDAIPATDVGSNAKRRLRTIDAGFNRQYRRQPNPNPQPSRDARLRQLLKGRGVFARLPAIGVQVQSVHTQHFDATVAGQTFSVMLNLGEAFAGRIIIIAITNIFQSESSGGNYLNVFLDGQECTEEGVESGGSMYSLLLPAKTNALLTFETDSGHDTTGMLTVQAFNVRGAVLPPNMSDFGDTSLVHVVAPLDVMPYGAILVVNGGPGFEENPHTVWSANVDLDIIADSYAYHPEFNMRQLAGAAWKQVQTSTNVNITITGEGEGSSFQNVTGLAIALGPPHITIDETFFNMNLIDTVVSGVSINLVLPIDGADGADGNDYVFNSPEIGGGAGRLLIFAIAGQFFLGDQGQTLVGASYNGVALTELSNIVSVGGYSFGAMYYIVDPGFSSPGEFRLTFGLDPLVFGFPQAFLSVWSITGQHDTTPILDNDDVFDATSDGVEDVTLAVEENGGVVAITFGATYGGGSETNAQTWTNINNSTVFGFNTVLDVGSLSPITADDPALVITSDDDDDIADQIGAEKFIMAVSIKPAPPIEFDVIVGEVFTPLAYTYTLGSVAAPSAILITPASYSYSFIGTAEPGLDIITPAGYTYAFTALPDPGADTVTPAAYEYRFINLGIPPGVWFEGDGITDNWVEQSTETDNWTEQGSISSSWAEE